MKKFAPWILAVILSTLSVSMYVYYKGIIEGKDAEIKSLTDKNSALVADANAKLKEAGEQIRSANARAQEIASDANSKIQALAADANQKIQAANQPEPTVSISFRKALLGSGNVAVIKNTSSQSISLSLAISRPSTNQQNTLDVVLDPARPKEIGHREGWAFILGDSIVVSQPGHKTVTFSFR